MVTINDLANLAIRVSKKNISFRNIYGKEFKDKYGFDCPVGVMGRNSDNRLFSEKVGWEVSESLEEGLAKTYPWIEEQIKKSN